MQKVSKTLLALFGMVAVFGIAVPASADPFLSPHVGDVYVITTMRGYATAYVDGQLVTLAADIQLKVRIVAENVRWISFRVASGTLRIGDVTYTVLGEWPGLYNRISGIATYQGYGADENGRRGFFSLVSVDTGHTQQGAFMDLRGSFRDPAGVYWTIRADLYRFKLN